jgi:hypothetical protein
MAAGDSARYIRVGVMTVVREEQMADDVSSPL